MPLIEANIIYALAWLSFGFGHSMLASSWAKDRLASALGPHYRLTYNIFAVVHISAIWLVGEFAFTDIASFAAPQLIANIQLAITILGLVILVVALWSYDLGRLLGWTQIRNHRAGIEEPEDEPLNLTGFHAYVRHPVYTGAYLILWGRVQDDLGLATAIWGTVYLAIGTMFEERRLLALYGEAYENYRAKVPAVIPWRGKAYVK
jgi:methanethiol S-methyltransferase